MIHILPMLAALLLQVYALNSCQKSKADTLNKSDRLQFPTDTLHFFDTPTASLKLAFPMQIVPILSGDFGEIRDGHFHSGIDFKTEGRTGIPIYASADGWVTKIFVHYGSGMMLHVAYKNGISAIYRHNERFAPKIARCVRNYQYKNEKDSCEIAIEPQALPVKKGELLCYSGNEGYSKGPHLHLDLYETETGIWLNPLPYFDESFPDHKAPVAQSIMVIAEPEKGAIVTNGPLGTDFLPTRKVAPNGGLVQCWGKVGLALKAYDTMDGAYNLLGVRGITLKVDGKTVFMSNLNRFSRNENNLIYSWLVQGHLKSFVDPGFQMGCVCIPEPETRGLITISEERDYHVEYILSDDAGNTSHYKLTLRGKKINETDFVPQRTLDGAFVSRMPEAIHLYWDQSNQVSVAPGLSLDFPRGCFTTDTWIAPSIHAVGTVNSKPIYQLTYNTVMLTAEAHLTIALHPSMKKGVNNNAKYFIARIGSGIPVFVGNTILQGTAQTGAFLTALVDRLGTYRIDCDTIAPKIIPQTTPLQWQRSGILKFRILDSQTPIVHFRGTIDGKWQLFQFRKHTGLTTCDLKECGIRPTAGLHKLVLVATDACGNTNKYEKEFTY